MSNLPASLRKRNLDNGDGSLAGIANTYSFTCVGVVPGGGNTVDQCNLFNIPTDQLQGGAVLTTNTQLGTSGFTLAQIASHFGTHPAPLVNWNIPASTNAAVLASMIYSTVRKTPSNKFSQDENPVATLLTAQDFQSDRVQFSASGTIMYDGETFARFTWNQQNPAVTVTISLSFGPEVDLRAMAQRAAPVTIG